MPHKYTTEEVIRNLEEDIRVCDSSIERIRLISRGGPDAIKQLVSQIKDFLDVARNKKDMALDTMMENGAGYVIDAKIQERAALLCRGQEKAFAIVLDMLENSEQAVRYYVSQKEMYEKELVEKRKFEQRKS